MADRPMTVSYAAVNEAFRMAAQDPGYLLLKKVLADRRAEQRLAAEGRSLCFWLGQEGGDE